MATLASSPPSSPSWPKRRPRAWALRCERYCCAAVSYFPLTFVYSLTTWAVYVEASIGLKPSQSIFIGLPSTIIGIVLYLCLNVSYTVAVFTDPGSPLTTNQRGNGGRRQHQYSALPVTERPEYTAFMVSSSGGSRYCKKCQSPKPDRAHHCSSCKRCVLKMDHHCPWLATCVGLYNYKAFLLFLIYTSLFCWVSFLVASTWIWTELLDDSTYMESMMPVNVVLLAIIGGIIGLVLSGFTGWHISLAIRGVTTIECLEKTRYVSPLRKALDPHRFDPLLGSQHGNGQVPDTFSHRLQDYGHQILDAHANAIPGVTRAEEGEERTSPAPQRHGPPPPHPGTSVSMENLSPAQQALTRSYVDLESQREHDRYQEYLNEEDNEKMPHAFDLGWRRNLLHLFGDRPVLWFVPICTTTGDGWQWEPSRKFLDAHDRARHRREQDAADQQQYYRDLYQRNQDNGRSWLGTNHATPPSQRAVETYRPRDPERPTTGVSMKTLPPMSPRPRPGDSDYEEDEFEPTPLSSGSTLSSSGSGSTPNGARKNKGTDEWRDWD